MICVRHKISDTTVRTRNVLCGEVARRWCSGEDVQLVLGNVIESRDV